MSRLRLTLRLVAALLGAAIAPCSAGARLMRSNTTTVVGNEWLDLVELNKGLAENAAAVAIIEPLIIGFG